MINEEWRKRFEEFKGHSDRISEARFEIINGGNLNIKQIYAPTT